MQDFLESYTKINNKIMSRVKTNRSLTDIELLLERTTSLLDQNIAKGDYVAADGNRIAIEQLKKDREIARVRDLERRHQEERHELAILRESETKALFARWEARIRKEAEEAERAEKELQTRQVIEEEKTREALEVQSPTKVKESPECLNLRKQEAFMVKQKNYAQAHIVQAQIAEMQRIQKEKWMFSRKLKIDTAIKHLRQRHQNQHSNLMMNIKATQNQSKKQRSREEEQLELKFNHLESELSMKQEKEKLALKGEFTSKGGEGSVLLTKSRLLKSRD